MARARILDTGLSTVYEPLSSTPPLVDIIFVHGLQGHPYKTWATKRVGAVAAEPSGNENEQETFRKRALRRILPIRSSSAAVASGDGSVSSKRWRLGDRQSSVESPGGAKGGNVPEADTGISAPNSSGGGPTSATLGDSPSAVFWPSELLHAECPDARILTWGYDTRVTKYMTGPTNKNSIFSHAKDLLFAVGRARPVGRRIIFVAHSLGGIVVKEMLSESSVSGESALKDIIESTSAVIFFGTPHRGSAGLANIGETVRRVATKVLRMDTSHAPLLALGLHSAELERCQDAFSRLWAMYDFRVKTFQEGLALTGFNIGALGEKVVPDYSSLLGNPNEHAETLQANHMEMCRFKGPGDPNYLKVSNELRDMYRSLQSVGKEAIPEKTTTQKNTTDPHVSDKESADIKPPVENTCAWILAHDVFKSWIDRVDVEKHRGLLWIKGKPGSGKSTIVKAVSGTISQRVRDNNLAVASFYFNAKGQKLERTHLGLLRSLLYQVLRVNTRHLKAFVDIYQEKLAEVVPGDGQHDVEWQASELETQLNLIFQDPGCRRTVIFVDALDECDDGDARDVAVFLRRLSSLANFAGIALNVCISSRHFPSITIRDTVEITMEQFNQQDMRLFIRSRFSSSDIMEDKKWAALENDVVEKSCGIFLWVVLVIDMLLKFVEEGHDMKFLRNRLRDVPEALETLFTTLLAESHHDTSTTIRLFQWAVLSPHPLRLREWHHILAFIRSSEPPRSLHEWRNSEYFTRTDDQLERQLRSISKGLLEVAQNSEPAFTDHVSNDRDSVQAGAGSLDAGLGETRVVEALLDLGASPNVRSKDGKLTPFFAAFEAWRTNPGIAEAGRKIVQQLVKYGAKVNMVNQVDGFTPLHVLCDTDPDIPMMEILLENGANLCAYNNDGETPLHLAFRRADLVAAKTLLAHGANINAPGTSGETPLLQAVSHPSDYSVVEFLIASGAEVNAKDREGRTPLIVAAGHQPTLAVVQLLLENGADPNVEDDRGRTPLLTTIESDYPSYEVVRLLLENGAAVTSKVVFIVATNSSRVKWWIRREAVLLASLLDLMLEYGGDVHAIGPDSKTPLHLAVSGGYVKMVDVLIRRGANPNLVDKEGNTPLHLACSVSHHGGPSRSWTEMIRALLASGADICAKNKNGRTPLDLSDGSLRSDLVVRGILRQDEVQAVMTR
ncbi:uncharacterized protein DNG_10057 [Cephalotrichum gorgonifer]|uniref:Nephrocystin 3-like N-terminal domain-containing protein n=1 Tax=Cephalotrichum gorgonifer TaxID=2041049 RepID=A0AAE8SZZ5_9PEZI|nr:uncharacterized protein DNG_10057 [Cephalotrichum gorgonifer]